MIIKNKQINMKTTLKSLYASLSKNDYFETFMDTLIGGLVGYILPILYGTEVFSTINLKAAVIGAAILGLRKAVTLFFTNSTGQKWTKEIPAQATPAQPTEVNKTV